MICIVSLTNLILLRGQEWVGGSRKEAAAALQLEVPGPWTMIEKGRWEDP